MRNRAHRPSHGRGAPISITSHLLTANQVARKLDLPPRIVRRFIASGVLAATEPEPGLIRIAPADLHRFLDAHPWVQASDY